MTDTRKQEDGRQPAKKFLIITNHSYMLWQFRRELIEALLKKGEVVISTPFVGHEQDFMDLGCRCIETQMERRGINPLREAGLFRYYHRLLKTEKPDLVITYSIKPNIYAGLICRRMKIPYCANVQGLGTAFESRKMAPIATLLYRSALKKARTVFFENTENRRIFVEKRIISKQMATLLTGAGVNLDQYKLMGYPTEEKGIHLLYLGRIMREKGMDELFVAIRRIKAEYGDKVCFDLVGFFEDDYKQIIEDMQKDGLVVFHGFQKDPKPFYEAAHGIVMPSWHEGMSNVLLEAAATGRAVITSNIPGCREAVTDGVTGLLAEVKNAESLYGAIKTFLSLTAEERAEMGKRGREKMENEFDRARVVNGAIRAMRI